MGNAGGGVDCNVIPSFFVTSGSVNVRTRTAMAESTTAVRIEAETSFVQSMKNMVRLSHCNDSSLFHVSFFTSA